MLENRMLIDSEWGESEYGVPLPRKRDKLEEDDENDGRSNDAGETGYYGRDCIFQS